MESLVKGTAISVNLKAGDKVEGTFGGLDANAIRIAVDGKELMFPRESVAEVRYAGVKGHMVASMIVGTVAGFFVGSLAGYGVKMSTGSDAAFGGTFAGILAGGIGLGYVIGKHSEGAGLIYRSADQRRK